MGKRNHPEAYTRRYALRSRQPHPAVVVNVRDQGKCNWRVKQLDHCVMAFEPDGEHEQVFDKGKDPFWDAVEYAAACLRGEISPAE